MNVPDTTVNDQIAADYDDTPYTSNAFYYASPGHIRAAARLYNVEAPPLERARVLELGCAAGANLLPFALAYPDATVVGVDLSSHQISQGQKVLADLNVRNVRLHAMSLEDITPDFGEFDYIVAHGVFSWVPPQIKGAMLRVCRQNLSPRGIAYISYNTYPGWKAGDIVRDAMLLHSHGADNAEERLARAKAMLSLLSEGLAVSNPLRPSLLQAVGALNKYSDYYLTHEYLEAINTPCYLVEFAEAASAAGLAYVGDSEPHTEMPAKYGQNVQLYHGIMTVGQPKLLRQQYLDFAVGRNFRKSLLVHRERSEEIAAIPNTAQLRELRFAGHYTRVDDDPELIPGAVCYSNSRGQKVHSSELVPQFIMRALTVAWPRSLSWFDLLEQIQREGANCGEPSRAESALDTAIAALLRTGTLHISMELSPYDRMSASQPTVVPGFAYLNKRSLDPDCGVVSFNLWHDSVPMRLPEAEQLVVGMLDGTNGLREVRSALCRALQEGKVALKDGKVLTGQRNLEPFAQKVINALLKLLREKGLLLPAS
ncbi:hypothetical protein CAL14_12185 [Bordetella genomosp. 9]|uniref:methyltransferase regulatory domain-containing protein n=1 Tax=Bordetella genomosp. 9 TaxID=1416803 RepID=UPI000A28E447|nr:class I SAM-dependent methyltransferase [Bordetella genomosp. 9]ARP90956.1 hypothetical protein CAL14_12185 [Bordetella genomosp. 9]